MNGLVHISKYLNEFKEELEAYDAKLTQRAEEVSEKVKEIQERLSELKVDKFGHGWEEKDGEYYLSLGLIWDGSRIKFGVEENEPEFLLGATREIRVDIGNHLDDFLKAGLDSIKKKIKQLD